MTYTQKGVSGSFSLGYGIDLLYAGIRHRGESDGMYFGACHAVNTRLAQTTFTDQFVFLPLRKKQKASRMIRPVLSHTKME